MKGLKIKRCLNPAKRSRDFLKGRFINVILVIEWIPPAF
jgi:hypothetical protein